MRTEPCWPSDITAGWPLPPFDNSAMDGYAVLAGDVAAASQDAPVSLPVIDEMPAGDTRAHQLVPGSCLRIMTGALLPAGADAVVPVEWTDGGTDRVAISRAPSPATRSSGPAKTRSPGDVCWRQAPGSGPPQIGLLAAAGRGSALGRPRPRITVISTGNELAEPGAPVVPGQIWESNSSCWRPPPARLGCPARRCPDSAATTPTRYWPRIEDAAATADLLVTSGGVSMGGEHDVVKAALQRLGTVRFTKVAMQPGMPQGFGVVGENAVPMFTLPGNPVSAFVSFQLFVRPARLMPWQDLEPERLPGARAVLTRPVRSPAGKRSYLRGILDAESGTVTPVLGQASHQLASLAKANAFIVVKERLTEMAEGDIADVLELP